MVWMRSLPGVWLVLLAPVLVWAQGATLAEQTRAGVERLQEWYVPATGLYRTTGWWNSANAVTTLVDFCAATGSGVCAEVVPHTFEKAQETSRGFLNNFYDDEGWWALAWVASYDLTHEARYLAMARAIFADMSGGWDGTCGGGIWWSKDRKYKNAIANELFLSVAANLANRTRGAERAGYLRWAQREWGWFRRTGMINGAHVINDGLDAACKNNGKAVWSYNQGVVLGGLAELHRAVPDRRLLGEARMIADAAMEALSDSHGVLHEPTCEPGCGADGVQFKGIFVRNLAALHAVVPEARYATFARVNAASIWSASRGPRDRFGEVWTGPYGDAGAGAQSSALDAFVAALRVAGR